MFNQSEKGITGGCYCGALRFQIVGRIQMRAWCLCRTCQKISGGGGNQFIGIFASDFRYTQGQPRRFKRVETPDAPAREFCADCGVHIAARSPKAPGGMIVKVGTLDHPASAGDPALVFWTDEKQLFHLIPEGATVFAKTPGLPLEEKNTPL